MLFEDLDTLDEMIDLIRSGADNRHMNHPRDNKAAKTSRRFRDLNDPEIDRLYSTSPPESEQVGTFELDNALLNEYQNPGEDDTQESEDTSSATTAAAKAQNQSCAEVHNEYRDRLKVFKKKDIDTGSTVESTSKHMSGLSMLLNSSDGKSGTGSVVGIVGGGGGSGGGMNLTIYLPNRQPIDVAVDPSGTVDAVIKTILLTDKASSSPTTSLHHHAPQCYDLRLHEGDGEPDEDFPALDRKRILKQFGNVSEYCMCRKSGVSVPPPPSGADSPSTKSNASDDSLPADMIVVLLPNAGHTKLRLEPSTTPQDLIGLISKTHRLKLYTVDYICCLTEEDQRRLQYYSPILEPSTPILNLGIKKLELQQRVYADSSRLKALKRMNQNQECDTGRLDSTSLSKLDETMLFTDITAAVYQEWNVVKKNKFGRMQERILGIDGTHMYNSRRLGHGTKYGVAHAMRDLNTVVSVHAVSGDPLSFRVTFDDDREIYDIGYTCDTKRECFEIIAKLRYLLAARNKAD